MHVLNAPLCLLSLIARRIEEARISPPPGALYLSLAMYSRTFASFEPPPQGSLVSAFDSPPFAPRPSAWAAPSAAATCAIGEERGTLRTSGRSWYAAVSAAAGPSSSANLSCDSTKHSTGPLVRIVVVRGALFSSACMPKD